MKLLFDNNLSVILPDVMEPYFPASKHIYNLHMSNLPDRAIWQYARDNDFSIVTKDKDFYHLANTLGHPPKIIWLTVGNCRNIEVINMLTQNKDEVHYFLKSENGILILR